MKYDFRRIEEKWQSYWGKNDLYTVSDSGENRYYTLEMFRILRANFTWDT